MEKQKAFSKRKKVVMFCLISVFTLMCAGGGLVHWLNNERSSINATQNTDTTSYVMVDEIWNSENESFNAINLSALLQYITGDEDITASDVASTKINQTRTSADIRTSTANGKTTSQDVQVTFGGLTWQVVHLTQDRSKNDIVTLWLSNNYQQAWEGRPTNEGEHYGFIDGALYSDWSANWNNRYAYDTDLYPSSMYSTSYIRTVVLNNEGSYATSKTAATSVTQSTDSVFAIYTMGSVAGSVTKYLVTPSQVKYQETENANTQFGESYYRPNEAYGTPNGNGAWNTSDNQNYDFSSREVYDDWAEDTLWLPSRTETGYSGTTGNSAGIWQTSTAQRASNTGSDSSMGSVGSTSGTAYNYSWLRSGYYSSASNACYLNASGSGSNFNYVPFSYAVRPALHLNLNSAAKTTIPPTTWDGISTEAPTLQNPAQANSEDNPYIIDSAAKLAYLSENYVWADEKYFLQTENLDLASHPWTPINNVSSTSSSNRRVYYYDGGGHTISNLYINTSEQTLTSSSFIGLFGYVNASSSQYAYIKNLGIVNGSIAGEGSRYVGAVVGYAWYTDITNCYNEKTDITITGSSQYVGGVVGQNSEGTISGSYNTGTVSGSSSVGGITGRGAAIIDCYNIGTISGTGQGVGGVVGMLPDVVQDCYNEGIITGSLSVGGLVGEIWNDIRIVDSYNSGQVIGTGDFFSAGTGGIAGGASGRSIILGCYNTASVTGQGRVGGILGIGEDNSSVINCYNLGQITGTGNYIGGVVGSRDGGHVELCCNEGNVSSSGDGVGGIVGMIDTYGNPSTISISNCYNTGDVSGGVYLGGIVGDISQHTGGHVDPNIITISSCFSTGAVTRTSGSDTTFGGVVGYIENRTSGPSRYVSISWCYYNTETVGSVVTKAIGYGTGYQVYGLTTAQMQGDKNQNYMYLSDTVWNFASGEYPTLKYVAKAPDDNEHTGGANQ